MNRKQFIELMKVFRYKITYTQATEAFLEYKHMDIESDSKGDLDKLIEWIDKNKPILMPSRLNGISETRKLEFSLKSTTSNLSFRKRRKNNKDLLYLTNLKKAKISVSKEMARTRNINMSLTEQNISTRNRFSRKRLSCQNENQFLDIRGDSTKRMIDATLNL